MSNFRYSTKHILTVLLICFSFLLVSEMGATRHQFWWVWCLSLLATQMLVQYRREIVAIVSLAFHFILDPISLDILVHLHKGQNRDNWQIYLIHFFSMLGVVLFVGFLSKFSHRFSFFRASTSHFRFLSLYFASLAFVFVCDASVLRSYLIYFLILVGRFIWPLSHQLLLQGRNSPTLFCFSDTWKQVGLMAPFWSYMLYYLPIPTGVQILEAKEVRNEKNQEYLGRALKASYWALGLYVLHNAAVVFIFGIPQKVIPFFTDFNSLLLTYSLRLPDFYTSLVAWNQSAINGYERVLTIWGRDILFVLELFPTFGIAIAVSKAMGFDLPRMIYRPFQARTFIEYMGSFLYYYRQFLVLLFFEPLMERLRREPRWIKKNSAFLSLFFAIVVGGFLFHFNRDALRLGGSFVGVVFLQNYLNVLPYFISIGLLASFSRKRIIPIYQPLRILIYFCIHPIIIFGIMSITRFKATLPDYYQFLFKLWMAL